MQQNQDKKIFVNEACYEKALELISTILSNANLAEENIQELEEIEDNDDSDKRYKWIRHLLGFFILGIPCIIIVMVIIFYIFAY